MKIISVWFRIRYRVKGATDAAASVVPALLVLHLIKCMRSHNRYFYSKNLFFTEYKYIRNLKSNLVSVYTNDVFVLAFSYRRQIPGKRPRRIYTI